MFRILKTTVCILLVITVSLPGSPALGDKVTYRLKWLINMSTVGDVVAESQGFFKAGGLDATLKAGGPERDAIRELELGYADFGVASADQVIYAAAKGSPVVVIAQLFQVNPQQWVYFKDKVKINDLQDLKKKTIGVTFGKNDEIIMRTLLNRAGIADDQVRLYSVRLDYTPFYRRQVDLWPVYTNTQAVEIGRKIKDAGEEVGFLNPADHGVHFVSNSVVVSDRLLAENPELVSRFLKALLDGWRFAVEPANTEAAVAAVQRYDHDTPRELLVSQLQATRPLIRSGSGKPIGHMDHADWEQTEQIMLNFGQIDKPVDIAKRLRVLPGADGR